MRVLGLIAVCILVVSGCSNARLETIGKPHKPVEKLECGIQRLLTVFQDKDGDQVYGPKEMVGVVVAFTSGLTAAQNYGYRNFSAHPVSGPHGESEMISTYFYYGPDGLSFNFLLDRESGSAHNNRAEIAVTVRNNFVGADRMKVDKVLLSDEFDEFMEVDADSTSTFYKGLFDYRMTTDGAVVGPLVNPDVEIHFSAIEPGVLKNLTVFTPRGKEVSLNGSLDMMIKFTDVNPCVFD